MSSNGPARYEIHLGDRAQLGAIEGEEAELNKQNREIINNYMKSINLTEMGKENWVIAKRPWDTLTTVIHEQTTVQDLRTVAHWLKNYPAESYGVYGNVTSAQDLVGLLDAVWEELRHLKPASFISREDRDKAIHNVRMARDSVYMTRVLLEKVGDSEVVSEVEKRIKDELNPYSITKNDVMLLINKAQKAREDERKRIAELGMF